MIKEKPENLTENELLPIRKKNEGFARQRERYLDSIRLHSELPVGLGGLAFDWPVDMSNPLFNLPCLYGENNFIEYGRHNGIDIQAPLGTKIFSPIDLRLLAIIEDPRPGNLDLVEICLFSEETGIFFNFAHVGGSSLSDYLTKYKGKLVGEKNIVIPKGAPLGAIGAFPELDSRIPVEKDVVQVYGRKFNHLHILTCKPEKPEIPCLTSKGLLDLHEKDFNPLLVLKRLY